MRKSKYTKELLEEKIKECRTLKQLLTSLGLSKSGGSFEHIKKKLIEYNIDFSFLYNDEYKKDWLNAIRGKGKYKLNDILVENSTYNRVNLKNRLYEEGLKSRKCELCGQGEEWIGKKMSLILDHINGIPDDNRLENLRIVCPNCNATLDTHCGKNIKRKQSKNKVEKTDLRKILTDKRKISIENSRKVIRPSYENLLNDINELGYSGTGRKYAVSDTAIRKWVKYYNKCGSAGTVDNTDLKPVANQVA